MAKILSFEHVINIVKIINKIGANPLPQGLFIALVEKDEFSLTLLF